MKLSDADLERALSAERAEPEHQFTAELDAWAAAGFPRGLRPGTKQSTSRGARGAWDRFRTYVSVTPPRRLFAPVAAAATIVIVTGVTITESDWINQPASPEASVPQVVQSGSVTSSASADSVGVAGRGGAVPQAGYSGIDANGKAGGTSAEAVAPAAARDAGALKAYSPRDSVAGFTRSSRSKPRGADLSRIRKNRKVQRDAQMTLSAKADDVPDVAGKAAEVVDRYNGVVLSSQVSGDQENADATMRLSVPSKDLDATLSDLAGLAEVRSRSENTQDITKPFVSARDQLAGLRAQRESLLKRLSEATTDEETQTLKGKLSFVQQQIANQRASVDNLKHRADVSRIDLEITSQDAGSSGDGSWSFNDALHDAGHALSVMAGVALISGAIALPLALIAALAYFALSAGRGRARERALDSQD